MDHAQDELTAGDAQADADDDGEDVGKPRNLANPYEDCEVPPIAIAPDGGIVPQYAATTAIPAATPATFVCLRGPCRYYWQLETLLDVGNPEGTFGPDGLRDPLTGEPYRFPRQIHRTCLAGGVESDLTESTVAECSRWDPLLPGDLDELRARRRAYLASVDAAHNPKVGG